QKDCQAHVRTATKLAPQTAEPHLSLALIHDQIGGMSESERELRTADKLRPGDWRIQLLLARNLMGQKRFDDALKILEANIEAQPNEGALHAAAADALLQQVAAAAAPPKDILDKALQRCRDYARIAPDSPEAQFLLGKALMANDDRAGARAQWEAVYKKQPDFGKLRISLGNLLVRDGDRSRGAQLLQEARKDQAVSNDYHRLVTTAGQNRNDPDAHRKLARHCMEHGRLPRAIVEWEEVLRLKPDDRDAKSGIAEAKRRRGDLPE
ncbi:MAG: tetratricopeptide repeat protein, partial [Armatimonadaceae bacterium]